MRCQPSQKERELEKGRKVEVGVGSQDQTELRKRTDETRGSEQRETLSKNEEKSEKKMGVEKTAEDTVVKKVRKRGPREGRGRVAGLERIE